MRSIHCWKCPVPSWAQMRPDRGMCVWCVYMMSVWCVCMYLWCVWKGWCLILTMWLYFLSSDTRTMSKWRFGENIKTRKENRKLAITVVEATAAFGAGVLFLIASHLAECDDMAFIHLFTHVLTHFFFTQGVSVSSSVCPSLPPEVLGFSLSLWFQMFWDWRCLGEEVISWQEARNSQRYNSLPFIPFFSFLSVYLWLQQVSWYFSLNCENSVFATSKHQGRKRGFKEIWRHVCVCVSISQGQGTMWPSIKCSLC